MDATLQVSRILVHIKPIAMKTTRACLVHLDMKTMLPPDFHASISHNPSPVFLIEIKYVLSFLIPLMAPTCTLKALSMMSSREMMCHLIVGLDVHKRHLKITVSLE